MTDETIVFCDWCDEPRAAAVDRMEVSNGADDVLLHLDLCRDHAAELSNGGMARRILKAEKVQRIRSSMV
ncbi:MAG: hypothetical protein ACYDCC_04955 [Actinomycetota bacterium]